MRRQYAAAFKRTTLHAKEEARAPGSREREPLEDDGRGGEMVEESFPAGPDGGGGINFPRVVMLIDTSGHAEVLPRYTKGCAEQTRSVPGPFNALVSDVTALELPSILQYYALTRKVAVADRMYGVFQERGP